MTVSSTPQFTVRGQPRARGYVQQTGSVTYDVSVSTEKRLRSERGTGSERFAAERERVRGDAVRAVSGDGDADVDDERSEFGDVGGGR